MNDLPTGSNISIPLIIEDVKLFGGVTVLRCIYFSIESDDPSPGWTLYLSRVRLPFFLLGLEGIILTPPLEDGTGRPRFNSASDIRRLYEFVERDKEHRFIISTNPIWLPDVMRISHGSHDPRGTVLRISPELFSASLAYDRGTQSLDSMIEFYLGLRNEVEISQEETQAWAVWNREVIAEAVEHYPKNREYVLDYRDRDSGRGHTPRRGE